MVQPTIDDMTEVVARFCDNLGCLCCGNRRTATDGAKKSVWYHQVMTDSYTGSQYMLLVIPSYILACDNGPCSATAVNMTNDANKAIASRQLLHDPHPVCANPLCCTKLHVLPSARLPKGGYDCCCVNCDRVISQTGYLEMPVYSPILPDPDQANQQHNVPMLQNGQDSNMHGDASALTDNGHGTQSGDAPANPSQSSTHCIHACSVERTIAMDMDFNAAPTAMPGHVPQC